MREGRGGEPSTVEQLVHGCAALYIDLLKVKNDDPGWTGLPPPPPIGQETRFRGCNTPWLRAAREGTTHA